MSGGPSVIRKPTVQKSNAELTASLRSNFVAAQEAAAESQPSQNGSSAANGRHRPPPSWTSREGDILYVPLIDRATSGLAEERSQYNITLKLFYLPGVPCSRRHGQTKEAIALVLKELKVPSIDLLIASFPGVTFNPDSEDEDTSTNGCAESGLVVESKAETDTDVEDVTSMVETWRTLEQLQAQGTIGQLGVSEFGSRLLKEFLPHTKVRPSVDQINLRDVCLMPRSLMRLAKKEDIELLAHSDCTNILPRGTTRELLGPGEQGANVLAAHGGSTDGLQGEVEPQWVVKYTAVVKDRGVIENKGYFALAEMEDGQAGQVGSGEA